MNSILHQALLHKKSPDLSTCIIKHVRQIVIWLEIFYQHCDIQEDEGLIDNYSKMTCFIYLTFKLTALLSFYANELYLALELVRDREEQAVSMLFSSLESAIFISLDDSIKKSIDFFMMIGDFDW